jgi:hypothetical protein
MESKTLLTTSVILLVAMIPFAFILRPLKPGLELYLLTGCLISIALFLLPFFHINWSVLRRIFIAFSLPMIGVVVWCIGFVMADYKIITRLF